MSDKRERKTAICQPGAETAALASPLLADPPHPPDQALLQRRETSAPAGTAEQRDARNLVRSPELCLDMHNVLSRILAEGDDTEETLTRVCATLRDSMGWHEVSFWPAGPRARLLPSVSAVAPVGQTDTHSATIPRGTSSQDVHPDGHDAIAGTAPAAADLTRVVGGDTTPHTALPPSARIPIDFAFPVQGTSGLLGVIECRGGRSDAPNATICSVAASLGPAIGRFIERQHEIAEQHSIQAEQGMQAEDARRVNRLEAVIESLADSVVVFDRDGRILHANAADRAMFGYDSRSNSYTATLRERRRILKLHDEHDRPIVHERVPSERILRGETLSGPHAIEGVIRAHDGRAWQVSISGKPMLDEDGTLIGGIVVIRDITERRKHERALWDTNQRMKEFLAVAAHDIRAPITSTRGYVQLASKRLNKLTRDFTTENPALIDRIEDVHRNLADAEQSTQRLILLVDRLLDVARIQADKLDLRPETANLAAIVRAAVHEQRLAAPARVIRCAIPPILAVPVQADPLRVGQVLMNYLANALKYSPEDSAVEVTLDVRDSEVRVTVRDEGSGVPPAKQERIWLRFEQLEGDTHRAADTGLGLGLYISRAIVEAHGGRVGVESAEGSGSTFWFSLPLALSVH